MYRKTSSYTRAKSSFGGLSRRIASIWPGNKTLVFSSYSVPLGDLSRKGNSQDSTGSVSIGNCSNGSVGSGCLGRRSLGIRIVHLSDIQGATFGRNNRELLKRVAECNPHFVVVTGDLVDRRMSGIADFESSIELMGELQNIAPTFFTYGNHERAFHASVVDELRRSAEKVGVTVLDGESTVFDVDTNDGEHVRIFIAGFREELLMVPGKNRTKRNSDVDLMSVRNALAAFRNDMVKAQCNANVLLAHEPQFIHEYSSFGFDIIFSGHAHGGQIRLPGIGGLFSPGQGIFPKLTSGVHLAGDGNMVISRGLGNSSFPLRVFNRPEIVVVDV